MNKISLAKFLARYYQISNKNLSKMTHETIKCLLPQVKRCSFDYVTKNRELLEMGKVLMVEDTKGQVIPYVIPPIIEEKESKEVSIELESKKEKLDINNLEELSNYELIKALKEEKKIGTLKKIKKELTKRNIKQDNTRQRERQENHFTSVVNDYEGDKNVKYKRR